MGYEDKAIYAITESLKFLSIEGKINIIYHIIVYIIYIFIKYIICLDKPLNLIGISK